MRIRSSRSLVAYIVNLKSVWDTDRVSKSKEVSPKAKNFITHLEVQDSRGSSMRNTNSRLAWAV